MNEPMTEMGRALRDDPRQHGEMCDPTQRRADWCPCGQTENIVAIEAEAVLAANEERDKALDLLGRKAMELAAATAQDDNQRALETNLHPAEGLDVERLATVLRTIWPCLCDPKLVERANYHSPDCTHANPDADAEDIARAYADAGREK